MMDDLHVLETYTQFIINSMSSLDKMQEKEKKSLQEMHFYNKKSTYYRIWWSYDQYKSGLPFQWRKIYRDEMHGYETQDNWSILKKGGTLYAKTEIQKLVEQFYYKLSVGLSCLVSIYCNKTKKDDREIDKALWNNIFVSDIDQIMNSIYPYAMDTFNHPDILENSFGEKDKDIFVEINKKHHVNTTQPTKTISQR